MFCGASFGYWFSYSLCGKFLLYRDAPNAFLRKMKCITVGSKTETFPVVWTWSNTVDFIDFMQVDTIQVSQFCVVMLMGTRGGFCSWLTVYIAMVILRDTFGRLIGTSNHVFIPLKVNIFCCRWGYVHKSAAIVNMPITWHYICYSALVGLVR